MSRRRIELSGTQVIASMLAAVTGAIAASYTGIAGTMIGVAVMSVVSTAGSAVYKHYLARSQERLHSAAVVIAPAIAPLASHNAAAGQRRRASEHARAAAGQSRASEHARAAAGHSRADGHYPEPGWPATGDQDATQPIRSAGPGHDHAARPGAPDGAGQAAPGARPRWRPIAGAALGVFILTLGGITAVEVAAGKPLDALIWGRNISGTTIGDVTGAQHGRPASRQHQQPAAPSPSRQASQSPTPTPTSTSPTPTPTPSATQSPSPSPSPSPSSGSPAPASPSPTGSAVR
jgi:hypothetical protein